MLSVKPWSTEAVLRLVLYVFACLSAGVLIVQLFAPPAGGRGADNFPIFVINSLSSQAGVLVVTAFFLREHRLRWTEAFGLRNSAPARVVGLALGAMLLVLPVAWGLMQLSAAVLRLAAETLSQPALAPVVQQSVQTLQKAAAPGQKIFFACITVVGAPVVEEVFFRGILYPTVKQNGFPRLALWGTSLFFALAHNNAMTFAPLTLLALVLVWLYERTDNLLAPIITHSAFNTANFLLLTYEPELRRWLGS